MLGRMYTVPFTVTATTVLDIFEGVPSTAKPVRFHGFTIDGMDTDAAEMLAISLKMGHTTSGSGGSSATPSKGNSNDAAASLVAEIGNTTRATAGTIVTIRNWAFNVLNGLTVIFTPETRPEFVNGERWVLGLDTTPADSIILTGTIDVEELG